MASVVCTVKAEPFEAFTFKPTGVAIYQLGNFGTAAKKLWQSQAGEPPEQRFHTADGRQ